MSKVVFVFSSSCTVTGAKIHGHTTRKKSQVHSQRWRRAQPQRLILFMFILKSFFQRAPPLGSLPEACPLPQSSTILEFPSFNSLHQMCVVLQYSTIWIRVNSVRRSEADLLQSSFLLFSRVLLVLKSSAFLCSSR